MHVRRAAPVASVVADRAVLSSLPPYAPSEEGHVETGRSGALPSARFLREGGGRVYDVRSYPDPRRSLRAEPLAWIDRCAREEGGGHDAILSWMLDRMTTSQLVDFNAVVAEASGHVRDGRPVRFECHGGRHGSIVFAHAVAKRAMLPLSAVLHTAISAPMSSTKKRLRG